MQTDAGRARSWGEEIEGVPDVLRSVEENFSHQEENASRDNGFRCMCVCGGGGGAGVFVHDLFGVKGEERCAWRKRDVVSETASNF